MHYLQSRLRVRGVALGPGTLLRGRRTVLQGLVTITTGDPRVTQGAILGSPKVTWGVLVTLPPNRGDRRRMDPPLPRRSQDCAGYPL